MESNRLFILLLLGGIAAGVNGDAIIDSSLRTKRFLGGGGTENVMVSFTQGISSVIDMINQQNFSSSDEKRETLTSAQQSFTNTVQSGLQSTLRTLGVEYESFWINNKMIVPNVDSNIVNLISSVPGVAKVEKEPVINLHPMIQGQPWEEEFSGNTTRYGRQTTLSWGVEKIRANQVWGSYQGKGVVVANIDTGNGSSSIGFWGTIAGSNGIGVAPQATWIACKGCNSNSCGASQLYSCGQWIQCPTRPDGSGQNCAMAPKIVSNSWGGAGGQSWYDDVINSWRATNIIPVVSIGNSGPACSTAGSPGDRPKVIGVGSTESNERISSFSSLGPASDGTVKPDIAAPGGSIRSAWNTSDTAYNTISGTSMACSHVAGTIVLMQQKNSGLTYDKAYSSITQTAVRNTLDTSTARTCGGRSPTSYPNNVFGYGRIDALNSVDAA